MGRTPAIMTDLFNLYKIRKRDYRRSCLHRPSDYILLFAEAIYFSYFIKRDKCVMTVTHVLLYLQSTNIRCVRNK